MSTELYGARVRRINDAVAKMWTLRGEDIQFMMAHERKLRELEEDVAKGYTLVSEDYEFLRSYQVKPVKKKKVVVAEEPAPKRIKRSPSLEKILNNDLPYAEEIITDMVETFSPRDLAKAVAFFALRANEEIKPLAVTGEVYDTVWRMTKEIRYIQGDIHPSVFLAVGTPQDEISFTETKENLHRRRRRRAYDDAFRDLLDTSYTPLL